MKIEEIPEGLTIEYNKICDFCGLDQTILTQKNNEQKHFADIYLQCQCGNYIHYELPI